MLVGEGEWWEVGGILVRRVCRSRCSRLLLVDDGYVRS